MKSIINIKNSKLYFIYFILDLELQISITSYMIVTNHYIMWYIYHTEECKRFQNNNLIHVVATTYHKGQIISLTSKPQSRSIMWDFTRELDKESLLNQSPIYTKHAWSVLPIFNPTLMSMLRSHFCLMFYSRLPCVFHVP